MTNYEQHLLMKIAEEASEIAQIALKTIQFGATEKHPELKFNNVQRLSQELGDLEGTVMMLETTFPDHYANLRLSEQYTNAMMAKQKRIEKYARYSVQLGRLAYHWSLDTANFIATGEVQEETTCHKCGGKLNTSSACLTCMYD